MHVHERQLVAGLVSAILTSCSNPTDAYHGNVDLAREAWLASETTSYTFEVAFGSSWTPTLSGYYRMHVVDKRLITAVDPGGTPTESFALTIEGLWDQILAARTRGELNSVQFDGRGVPIETNLGDWAVDGGVFYKVRNFATSR